MAKQIIETDSVVVKFVGDSGDGMQLSGTLFSDAAALGGNDIATFPDYPAEIRAPHNTIAGVSGYQVHIGSHIYSSGDKCDFLVAMNPASFKSNLKWAKKGATIIVDIDTFTDEAMAKAGYTSNPFTDELEREYTIVKAPVTSFTKRIGEEKGADLKTTEKCRNMFALGIIFYVTNKTLTQTEKYLERKFAKKPAIVELNKAVLTEGYEYADKLELIHVTDQGVGNAVKATANLRGILKNTKGMLNPEDIKKQKDIFVRDYLNLENEGGIASLDASQEFTPIEMKPTVTGWETLEAFRKDVQRYYGVSDAIIHSDYTEEQMEAFYDARIEPFLVALSLELTRKIFTERERGYDNQIVYESNRIQYASTKTKLSLVQMVDRGAMTPNEWRSIFNLAPVEGGDVPIRRLDTAEVVTTNETTKNEEE